MSNLTSAVVLAAGLVTSFTTVSAQITPASDKMSIVGCLKEEKDVPGLTPSAAERAGMSEDFILVDAKTAPGSPVSGLALAPMYEIEGIEKSTLKKHLGHQVELEGRIAPVFSKDSDKSGLPDFNATSLKMLAATCPAK